MQLDATKDPSIWFQWKMHVPVISSPEISEYDKVIPQEID
jgi:hypothetical protein